MISLPAIPTDRPVFVLAASASAKLLSLGIGCLGLYTCLSYISRTATVRPLIYGCLSPDNPNPLHPQTDGFGLFTQGGRAPKLSE